MKNDATASNTFTEVTKLALQLHEKGEHERRIKLPEGVMLLTADIPAGCSLVMDELEFTTIAGRNELAAKGALAELPPLSNIDAVSLFDAAYELWLREIGCTDQASGRLLALAAERVDIIALGAQRINADANVFDILHLVEATFPYLDQIDVMSIIELAIVTYAPTRNDLAGNVMYGALEIWLGTRKEDALALHAKVLEHLTEETKALLVVAVLGISKSDYSKAVEIARGDASAELPSQADAGVLALGQLLLADNADEELRRVAEVAVVEMLDSDRGELRFCARSAAVGAMHKISAFDSVLQRLAEQDDQDVLALVARALFFKSSEMHARALTQRWLQLLTTLKPDYKGALRDLDYAMSRLVVAPENVEAVVSMVTQWIKNHGQKVPVDSYTAELFGDTMRALWKHSERWHVLVTDWLLSDQCAHPRVLAGILNQLHDSVTPLKLDKSRIDQLSAGDLMFLARRMLGYVHDRNQLTSLALSLLQANDAETRIYPLLRSLLVNEIGYDYPGNTVESIREAVAGIASKSAKEFLLIAADEIDQSLAVRAALPLLNELRPPPKLRQLFARARAKQMDTSYEKAQENSIFSQLATHIHIKAGLGTFSYRDSNFDPPMKLSTASYSIELPRREVFDPIGNAIRNYHFRNAKRDEQ